MDLHRPALLLTHDGTFHADDVCAAAILHGLFPEAPVLRTRDPATLTAAQAHPDALVFDVGGACDPDALCFDHHFRPTPARPDGAPYAAFGLVWQAYGMAVLDRLGVTGDLAGRVHARFDAAFVAPIDAFDNGDLPPASLGPMAAHTLPMLLDAMNTRPDSLSTPEMIHQRRGQAHAVFTEPTSFMRRALETRMGFPLPTGDRLSNAAFAAALSTASTLIHAALEQAVAAEMALGQILDAIAAQSPSPVLELATWLPFEEAMARPEAAHLRYVLHPGRPGHVSLHTIPDAPGSFSPRFPLPRSWWGLRHAEMAQASGVADATFCHHTGFMAESSSWEGARALAQEAIEAAGRG